MAINAAARTSAKPRITIRNGGENRIVGLKKTGGLMFAIASSRPMISTRRTSTARASAAAATAPVHAGRRGRPAAGSSPIVVTQKNASSSAVNAKSPAERPTGPSRAAA